MIKERGQFFIIESHILQIASTILIPLYYPPPFSSITIIVQFSSTGRCPSRNASFSNLAVSPTSVCMYTSTMLLPLANHSGVLYASLLGLPPFMCVGPSPSLQSLPSQGGCLVSTLAGIVSESACPSGGAACRVTPLRLRCYPAPP